MYKHQVQKNNRSISVNPADPEILIILSSMFQLLFFLFSNLRILEDTSLEGEIDMRPVGVCLPTPPLIRPPAVPLYCLPVTTPYFQVWRRLVLQLQLNGTELQYQVQPPSKEQRYEAKKGMWSSLEHHSPISQLIGGGARSWTPPICINGRYCSQCFEFGTIFQAAR